MTDSKICKISVKVVPNSSREEIVGLLGEDLKVRVKCPAENGRANCRLCQVVAQRLGLPENAVEITSGFSAARKILLVRGMDRATRLQISPAMRCARARKILLVRGMDREDVVKLLSRTT